MWEKQRLLIMSNFSFSNSVFERLILQTHTNQGLFGKGLKIVLIHNSLPNNKFLDWSKLKGFADDKLNATKKLKFVLGRIENIVGKGEIAGYQHFLLFPPCFQEASLFRVVKSWDCVVKS